MHGGWGWHCQEPLGDLALDSVIETRDIFRGSADGDLIPGFTSTRNPEASEWLRLLSWVHLVAEIRGKQRWRGLWGQQMMRDVWWGGEARMYMIPEFLSCCRLLTSCAPNTARSMGSCAAQTRLEQLMTG